LFNQPTTNKHLQQYVRNLWEEFRSFAFEGAIVELSASILMAKAFAETVRSLVKDVVLPPLSLWIRDKQLFEAYLFLRKGLKGEITGGKYVYKSLKHAREDGAVTVNFGVFLASLTNFIALAAIVFGFLRWIFHWKEKRTRHRDLARKRQPSATTSKTTTTTTQTNVANDGSNINSSTNSTNDTTQTMGTDCECVVNDNSEEELEDDDDFAGGRCRFCISPISVHATRCPYCRCFEPQLELGGDDESGSKQSVARLSKSFATLKKNLKKQLKQSALLQGGFVL
jgi:large conductance mechanosensitive channel